jgi:hypothetical protein
MATKKPAFLTPKNTTKKRNQPSSSSSSSSSTTNDVHDPVQHALQLDEHFVESRQQILQSSAAIRECLNVAKSVDLEIESIRDKCQNVPEFQKVVLKVKQLTTTVTALATRYTELEKSHMENQTAFELYRSSIFEYLLSTMKNDTELIAQFEQESDHIKEEKNDDDVNGVSEKPKKIPIRRGLVPSECR